MVLPAAAVYQVAVTGVHAGEPWANVLHFSQGDDLSLADVDQLTDLGEKVRAAYNTQLQPDLSEEWHLQQVAVTDINGPAGLQSIVSFSDDGAQVTDPLPSQMALTVSWRTALRGKSFRGRTFLNGWIADALDSDGNADGGPQIDADGWATAIESIDVDAFGPLPLVIYSRLLQVVTPVVSHSIDGRFDVIRHRNRH